jgi:hypothetical protein
MAKPKIAKDSVEYYEIKAKYEATPATYDELGNEYGVTGKTIYRFAKEGEWEKKKTNAIYQVAKRIERDKVLKAIKDNPKKIEAQTISNEAKKDGRKQAELILKSENYKIQMENKCKEIAIQYFNIVSDALGNIDNGKVTDSEFAYVSQVKDKNTGKLITGNMIKKTISLRPKDFDKLIPIMQAFKIIESSPEHGNQNDANHSAEFKDYENVPSGFSEFMCELMPELLQRFQEKQLEIITQQ